MFNELPNYYENARKGFNDKSEALKAAFAERMNTVYRVVPPKDHHEIHGIGNARVLYEAKYPLMSEKNQAICDVAIKHFNRFVDFFDDYYARPFYNRPRLVKKTSALLSDLCRELIAHKDEVDPQYEFSPAKLMGSVYMEAVRGYRDVHHVDPKIRQDQADIRIR